jgi:hypothetical protein
MTRVASGRKVFIEDEEMEPKQLQAAAHELMAYASLHIGDPVGPRCRFLAKQLNALAEAKPIGYLHGQDLEQLAQNGVVANCTIGSAPLAGLVAVYGAPKGADESADTIKQLKSALRLTLDWIDAVPQNIVAELPGMPGFDRDEVESLLS